MRFLRSQMNGGIGLVMVLSMRESPVTEPLEQVISGQLQWVEELEFGGDGVQWLMEGGLDQCRLSLSRIVCSESVDWEFPCKGRMRSGRANMERRI